MLIPCPNCQKTNRVPTERLSETPSCGACGEPLLTGVIHLNDETLTELTAKNTAATLPIMVDFWAPWCAPCQQFAPTFEAAAKQFGGLLLLAKIDTEAYQRASSAHQIRAIPTLMTFSRGDTIDRTSGALPRAALEQLINKVLKQTGTG